MESVDEDATVGSIPQPRTGGMSQRRQRMSDALEIDIASSPKPAKEMGREEEEGKEGEVSAEWFMVILNVYTSYESMFVSNDFCYGYLHLVDAVMSVLASSARVPRSQRMLAELMYMQPCIFMTGRGASTS